MRWLLVSCKGSETQCAKTQQQVIVVGCFNVAVQRYAYIMQIITGIQVSSEAISRSCGNIAQMPKARGQYSRNWGKLASLLIDDDSHYLYCYTSDRNGDGINLIICVILH